MNQRELQIWYDAVNACHAAAWAEIEEMEVLTVLPATRDRDVVPVA